MARLEKGSLPLEGHHVHGVGDALQGHAARLGPRPPAAGRFRRLAAGHDLAAAGEGPDPGRGVYADAGPVLALPRGLREVEPDVLVKGGDWAIEAIVGREFVEARGGRVVNVPLREGRSTTRLVERIRAGRSAPDGGEGAR